MVGGKGSSMQISLLFPAKTGARRFYNLYPASSFSKLVINQISHGNVIFAQRFYAFQAPSNCLIYWSTYLNFGVNNAKIVIAPSGIPTLPFRSLIKGVTQASRSFRASATRLKSESG